MFNSVTYKNESKVVAVTKEVEKTITPDRVTDMYDKVKSEVEDKILRTFVFDSNTLHGVVVELQPDYAQRVRQVLVRFTVNGVEEIEKFTVPEDKELSADNAYKTLVEAFQNHVTKMVLRAAYPKL